MKVIAYIKKSKFLVDFLSLLTSNISLLLLGVLGSIVSTRMLGPEGMGFLAVLTNFSLVFVSLAELGIRQSTIYFSAKEIFRFEDVFSANVNIWIFSSVVGLVIFYVIFQTNNVEVSIGLLLLSSFIIPVTIANSFVNGLMVGADKIRKSANLNIINGVFRFVLVLLLVWLLDLYVLGAILALLIPTTTLIFRKYYFLNQIKPLKYNFKVDFEVVKRLIGHGFLYGVALFLMTNQKRIPILVMTGRLEAYDIGIYSAGLAFASLLYNVYNALAPVIFLKSSKAKDAMKNSLKIHKLMRVIFGILLGLSIFLYFALEFIIPLMYGDRFIESIPLTRIMFIGIIFYNVFLILNMDMAGRGKPWIAIYALIPVTLINFFANFYFIREFGNIGAAFSTSLAMAVGALIYLLLYARELKVPVSVIVKPKRSDWDFISQLSGKFKI